MVKQGRELAGSVDVSGSESGCGDTRETKYRNARTVNFVLIINLFIVLL